MKLTSFNNSPRPSDALVDTAATRHFLQIAALLLCTHIENTDGPAVAVTNGEIITPQHK